MSEEDRGTVRDTEVLLRRCPDPEGQNFVGPIDYITKEPKLGIPAIRMKEGEDGLSVHRKSILDEKGTPSASVRTHPSQYVFAFVATVVRDIGWDVFWNPLDDGTECGIAHSLIALSSTFAYNRRLHNDKFILLRSRIIDAARVVVHPNGQSPA